jgi:hypothetical protein
MEATSANTLMEDINNQAITTAALGGGVSPDYDPDSEIIACVFPEGVVRLPLFHYAFSI